MTSIDTPPRYPTQARSDAGPDPDHELLQRWRAGAAYAGDRLCRRYEARLRRFFGAKAWPQDIDDLIQRTWLAMIQANLRPGMDPAGEAPPLEAVGSTIRTTVRAYLFGIARYILLGYYRQHYGEDRFDPDVDSLDALAPSLSQQLSIQRRVARLESALQSLPIELQLLTEARYLDELSGSELADMFGIPEGTVRSRLSRARRMVDEALARPRVSAKP